MTTEDHNEWERNWWGNCCNTLGEELKQLVYARHMYLKQHSDQTTPAFFDMQGKSILDIGGGPVSLLLKCRNLGMPSSVVDPTKYPKWIYERYKSAGITPFIYRGEDITAAFSKGTFDEVWIYNCLQHVDDPALVLDNARKAAHTIRIFEWIDIPPHPGHPHMLTKQMLDDAFAHMHGRGETKHLNESGCVGKAYYGVFTS